MKKISLILFTLLIITFSVYSQTYSLVWSDEFDNATVNTNEWVYEVNGNGGGNNELQYYTSRTQNSEIKDGKLVITALKENYSGKSYTSARLHTKKSWQYGKIEARMKLPYGQGIWPAFWMLGSNINSVGWPKCGEIDIEEMIGGTPTSSGGDRRVFGTAHWYESDQVTHAQYGLSSAVSSGKLSDDFHTFSIVWDASKIIWYFDSKQYCIMSTAPVNLNEFRAPYFIIVNLAVGGNWPGSPDGTTVFPQTMEIDYIRVYQANATDIKENTEEPKSLELLQNHPNPFNPSTNIEFSIPTTSQVTLKVLNILGQEVATLFDGISVGGKTNSVEFRSKNLTSGIYFSRLEYDGKVLMSKMSLMK